MTDRWDASSTLATVDALPEWLNESDALPAPTIFHGPQLAEGPISYGLVARVSLTKPAFGFRVEHDLPMGFDFIEAKPKPKVVGDHLIWQLNRLDPGQELRLEVIVRPQPGVEFDPKELADFTATYTQNLFLQAPVVRPRLTTRVSGPPTVAIGEQVEFIIDVVNTGNWVVPHARAVVTLPPELEHPDGPKFRFELGDLPAGEYRRVTLHARAATLGPATLRAEVIGPDDHQAAVSFDTLVVGPSMAVSPGEGPRTEPLTSPPSCN